MALSGSVSVVQGSSRTTGSWSATPNYVNNSYSVTFTAVTVNSVAPAYGNTNEVIVTVGGSVIWDVDDRSFNTSKTFTLSPNTSFNIKVWWGSSYARVPQEDSWTLPSIDRQSTVTLSSSDVTLGNSLTVSMQKKATSFTHKIQGGFSTSSLSDLATNVDTSASINFPVKTYASSINNGTSKQYIIRVITYSGSTAVGQVDKTITLNVPESYVDPDTGETVQIAPKLSNMSIAERGDVLWHLGKFYNERSRISVDCDVELSFSSAIKSCTLTFNGISKTSTSIPIEMDDVISVDSSTLPRTYTVELTVVDGRDRTASISTDIYIQSYSLNVAPIEIYRSDVNGNRDSEGTYIAVTGAYTKASIKDDSGNEQNFVRRLIYVDDQLVWEDGNVRETDAYNGMVILPTTGEGIYNINTVYNVRVGYGDAVTFYVVKGEATIPTALRPISINADGSAIAFGKPALNTDKGMYIYYDPVYIYGKLVASHIGQIIMSTTLDTEAKVIAEYGGEKWVQHSGYMLRGASSGVTASTENDLHNTADGGAEEVKLTVDQIPSHNHGSSGGITNGITGGSHAHTYEYKGEAASKLSGSNPTDFGSVYRRKSPSEQTGLSTASATHTHSLPNHTHSSVGGDKAHNNMPPYKDVYIWERIA